MSENYVIALIGAGGVVLAALVTGIFTLIKKGNASIIRQRTIGKNNTQIGIQNIYDREKGKHER